ncbi:hypothetical protein [Azohydromonas australica]|uniref:hypothetical protein n=1 Tax=Azohydromonas australica TaxID=364039 RepID=UPI0004138866|nr:hypothetical protein [Azohydromonas australica]
MYEAADTPLLKSRSLVGELGLQAPTLKIIDVVVTVNWADAAQHFARFAWLAGVAVCLRQLGGHRELAACKEAVARCALLVDPRLHHHRHAFDVRPERHVESSEQHIPASTDAISLQGP